MRPRRYFQYVEKGDTRISGIWKVFHIFCFIGVFISSMVGVRGFCEIFDIFNYRCVLYAKVSTKLTDIEYQNETNTTTVPSIDDLNQPKLQGLRGFKLNLGIFEDDYDLEVGAKHRKLDFSNAIPIPGVRDMYIYKDEIWLKNSTMIARAHVVMTTTVFATLLMCDFVIFVPFVSLIVSATFTLLVLLFSRTNRLTTVDSVPAAWTNVCPLLFAASTMSILAIVAFNLVYNGFNAFCARFVHLTGKTHCSPLMDYFTKEQKLGRRELFSNIKISQINFFLSVIFWVAEMLVTLTRLLCAADFKMTSVLIRKKAHYDDNPYDDEDHIYLDQFVIDQSSETRLIDVINQLKKQPKRD